jgi:hypothetical protein
MPNISQIQYHTSFLDPKVSGSRVGATSQIRAFAITDRRPLESTPVEWPQMV